MDGEEAELEDVELVADNVLITSGETVKTDIDDSNVNSSLIMFSSVIL